MNEIPVFGLTGKTTGAFAALELVVSHYYTNIPRPITMITMDWDISLPMDGSSYLLLIKNDPGGSVAMGYEGSEQCIFDIIFAQVFCG